MPKLIFSTTEEAIINLLRSDTSFEEVPKYLNIDKKTLQFYKKSLLRKFGCEGMEELILKIKSQKKTSI